MNTRYANIDLLRTVAITMVVIYHAINMAKPPIWLWKLAETGSFGVDLFFVLSGFLIGTLYFKEHIQVGSVSKLRFIGRRIFRTVPMYLIFMPLAYLPVYFIKKTPFDWQYLFFLQNYRTDIPFYVISWSLCVEEHFYFILPFILPFFLVNNKIENGTPKLNFWKSNIRIALIFILFVTPSVLRTLNLQNNTDENIFGYYHTATHFRYEGLLLGVLLAAVSVYKTTFLQKLLPYKKSLFIITPLLVLSAAFVPEYVRHSIYYSVIGLFFTFCVGVLFVHKPLKIASNKWINMIAISSYSTYLIHSLVIHAWVKIFNAFKITTPFFTVPVMIVSAFVMGYGVYFFIEKKLMYWRDEYLPARKKNASFVNPIYSDYASTVIR